jgi:TolB-like protein/Flp pilus assembly protein TadD
VGEPSKAVFLSYASQDAQAARRICEALRAAGIEVWFDQSELRGGDAWDRQIRTQIHECALFMPIISAHSQSRLEGYFRREWKLAVDRTHDMAEEKAFLVPVVIDDTSERHASVPDRFREMQWSRLPNGEAPAAFCERVKALLEGAATRAMPRLGTKSPPHPITKRSFRSRALVTITGALVAFVGGWQVWRLMAPLPNGAPQMASKTAGAVAPDKSIAVLPFLDLSEKKDQEYFSDGLSEELIDRLAHNTRLKVISRTSSFAFKGKNEDMRTIAAKLGVANLLEGSVRKAGNELRVTAQLIRASDGMHLWSESYERQLTDIFKVQEDISVTVAKALNVALSSSPSETTANTAAYNLLLKGNYLDQRGGKDNTVKALESFKAAVRLDPEYAEAWVRIGYAYSYLGETGYMSAIEAKASAQDAARRALTAAPTFSKAHVLLGDIFLTYDWDWVAARSEFAKALQLEPGSVGAQSSLAYLHAIETGNLDRHIELLRQYVLRDPLDIGAYKALAGSYWAAGRLDESSKTFAKLFELDPHYPDAQVWYATTLLFRGELKQALTILGNSADEEDKLSVLPSVYWSLGRKAESDAALAQLRQKYGKSLAYEIADVYAYRGEADMAFEWLDRASGLRSGRMPEIKFDPYLHDLHSDPRYKALLRKMRLPET